MKTNAKGIELAHSCLHCLKPHCNDGCPTGNACSEFVDAVSKGDVARASNIIYSTNPFPELTSRLCDCSKQCQKACVKSKTAQGPVPIQEIERYVSSFSSRPYKKGQSNGKSVAIVGAGISGLACAFFLLEKGFEVHIYEKEMKLGGVIYTGIPEFRFNKSYLDIIESDLKSLGAKLLFNKTLGRDVSLDDLRKGYDKVVIAIGAGCDNASSLSPCDDVLPSLSLLRLFNIHDLGEEIGRQYKAAYVWGGGNVALDCARSLCRVIRDVHVVYRRSPVEMPACKREIEEAIKEGVVFDYLTNIKSIDADDKGNLKSIKFVKMALGEPDLSGRASFKEIEDSEYAVSKKKMLIVTALGAKSLVGEFGIVNATSRKIDEKVYISGDCRYGAKTIADAIKDGVETAKEIINE